MKMIIPDDVMEELKQIDIYDQEILNLLRKHVTSSEMDLAEDTQDKIVWTLDFAGMLERREVE